MLHRTLDNTYARSPCAYCKHHKCSLTVKQVKKKGCLGKGCWYLKKYDHEWWRQRETIKAKKKQKGKYYDLLGSNEV